MNSTKLERTQVQRDCFPFVGDSIGGSHLSAQLLFENLKPPFESLVVVHERGPLVDHFDRCGIQYHMLPLAAYVGASRSKLGHARDILYTLAPVYRFLRENRITIVHPQDGRMNLTWALPARLAGCRFVWHQRSKYWPSGLTSLMARTAHCILCVSHFVADHMPREVAGKLRVIDDPHDTSKTPPDRAEARRALAQELGVSPGVPIVGFFGNLTAQKRPNIFLEAAARTAARIDPAPVFPLFGADRDGLGAGHRAMATALGIADRVRFMGFRSPVEPLMAACDLILATGVEEGLPRVLIEAMQVETPIVAARSGGSMEIVENEETGLLVRADDPAAFAEAALALLDDPARTARMGRAARASALNRYSIADHVKAVEAVYRELLA